MSRPKSIVSVSSPLRQQTSVKQPVELSAEDE